MWQLPFNSIYQDKSYKYKNLFILYIYIYIFFFQARILIQPQPGSFPGTWRFGELWDSIRQLFTPSPINRSSPD